MKPVRTPSPMPLNRAQRRASRRRPKTIIGASLIAFSGLAAGYLQALRPQVAYASTTCTAATEAALAACLTGLTSGQVTISLTADISLTTDLPRADLTTPAVDLTIDGNGYTIQGNGNSAFDIDPRNNDDTLLITDITITDTFTSGDGSALYLDSPMASATLERVMIENAYSNGYGGAVYAKPSLLNIIDSVFRGNAARDDYGGAVYAGNDVFVTGSTFIGNRAGGMGGGIYANDSAYVYHSYFADNYSGSYGGAVVAYDVNMTVQDSEFVRNRASEKGGALYSEAPATMSITRSTFEENAASDGGAVWFRRGGTTEIVDSSFSGNVATDSSGRGGAVYVPSNLSISGSTFTDNSAASGGAVASVEGRPVNVNVVNSTFDSNTANVASGRGGAIYAYAYSQNVNLALSFNTFVGNTTASADDSGSTIWGSSNQNPVTVTAVSTVIDDTGTVPCWLDAPNATVSVDDTFAFASGASAAAGSSCSFDGLGSDDTFLAGDFQLGSLQDNGGLTDTFLPSMTSPLVLRAPDATDLGDDTVAFDQRAAGRPSGSPSLFTIGAVQLPGDPAPGGSTAPVATAGDASATVASPSTTAGGAPTSWVLQAFTVDDTYLIPTDDTCAIGSASGSCTVTGLKNGQPYRFKATPSNAQGAGRASLPSNAVTPASNPTPPAPTPGTPPSAPRDVTAVAGDRSAVVSWREPVSSGSFPVSTYKATASPGGQSCLVVAPTLTCGVTGLANGTPYTFTVEALNGAGWSAKGGPSNAVTPGGVTPAPAPVPLPGPLPPGDSLLQTNGVVDPNVTVDPNSKSDGLVIQGDGWRMDLDGLGPDGKPLNLGPDGSLRLANERDVATEGTGFLPNSEVDLYVDPPVLLTGASARARSVEAVYVGTVKTDARGSFSGTATLPADITPGDHVLQAVGYSPAAQTRAMSLGVIVEPWIVLDQGTRKAEGMHDRIRTTGSSGGIDAGAKLTPWIRYAGQGAFTQGVASITVQSDGSFTWTREIKRSKGLTAYVSWVDTESNRVFWAKVR